MTSPADDWDDVTLVDATVQHHPQVATPTLMAIGLGPQLEEVERICAESQRGKHAGQSIRDRSVEYHIDKAEHHVEQWDFSRGAPDVETGASHLIHAAARLLMAAACADAEERS